MCLILLAWQAHPDYPVLIAANRDEHFVRPTNSATFWPEAPDLLAGRDLAGGGTWMGITRQGRFAALTNFREPEMQRTDAPSRGQLVSSFLLGNDSAEEYLTRLAPQAAHYNGFNLLCGELKAAPQPKQNALWLLSNRTQPGEINPKPLGPGIYGLSNHLLDTPWPKVAQGKSDLTQALNGLPDERALFALLRNDERHDYARLPRTGVELEWEKVLSAAFVRSPDYGTRSSTILKLDRTNWLSFDEQTYLSDAQIGMRQRFRFRLTC